jgi:hypothetical protein
MHPDWHRRGGVPRAYNAYLVGPPANPALRWQRACNVCNMRVLCPSQDLTARQGGLPLKDLLPLLRRAAQMSLPLKYGESGGGKREKRKPRAALPRRHSPDQRRAFSCTAC